MLLWERLTGAGVEAVIEPVTSTDFRTIPKSKDRFDKFDWSAYKGEEVFRVRLKTEETILGLLCLVDHPDEETNAIEIQLLEVSDDQIGDRRKYDNIAGCLIAFACRESFKRGHDGCVFLVPKTQLIRHYQSRCGFHHLPLKTVNRPEGLMIIYDEGARKLINTYLG